MFQFAHVMLWKKNAIVRSQIYLYKHFSFIKNEFLKQNFYVHRTVQKYMYIK